MFVQDLVACSLVCRFLNYAASDEFLWRRLSVFFHFLFLHFLFCCYMYIVKVCMSLFFVAKLLKTLHFLVQLLTKTLYVLALENGNY